MNPSTVSLDDGGRSRVAWLTAGAADAGSSAGGGKKTNNNNQQQQQHHQQQQQDAATTSGFATLGLDTQMLETITNTMHFVNPTPIQRKAIPLLMQGVDVVAMARTGSGKSAAFCIPMIIRLKEHSKLVGMRGVVLSPTRELALQTLRHFRMLAKHTDLKSAALTGGDSLNQQFEALAENPDVVVCSPGRVLHMCEETHQNLLSRVQVCVLDEADRLFEMGFQAQIVQIVKKIPESAQRSLFSATMPTILAEFTEAGLHNPVVVRLDSETKLSNSLKHSAFVVRGDEKYGALIYLLVQLIGVSCEVVATNLPTAEPLRKRLNPVAAARNRAKGIYGKGTGGGEDEDEDEELYVGGGRNDNRSFKQVLVFAESKHHVEFIGEFLPACYGIKTVAIHGSLDQEARRDAITTFRKRNASVLVVTDVAARGIDLPTLDYIVNFSFPHEPKLFIHRVGRVARAGREGTAMSLLTAEDIPYFFDVMQFLGKKPLCRKPGTGPKKQQKRGGNDDGDDNDDDRHERPLWDPEEEAAAIANFTPEDGCYGRIPTHSLQMECDTLSRLVKNSVDLTNLFGVTQRAHDKYTRTKKRATHIGMRAAHEEDDLRYENIPVHPMLEERLGDDVKGYHDAVQDLRTFKPKETVLDMVYGERQFSFGKKAQAGTGSAMLKRLTSEILAAEHGGGAAGAETSNNDSSSSAKPSLAETMAKRAAERRRERAEQLQQQQQGGAPLNSAAAGKNNNNSGLLTSIRPMFAEGADEAVPSIFADSNSSKKGKKGKAAAAAASAAQSGWDKIEDAATAAAASKSSASGGGDFRDKEFFMPAYKQETVDSQHLSLKGHAMDLGAESAEEAKAQRSVFAWNKRKNRYVKMNVNEAKALQKGMKNEAGKKIDFKNTKLEAYKNWTKSTNMRVQDVGEPEDLSGVRRAHMARQEAELTVGAGAAGGDDDDYDESLLKDPKHQQKARVGRKMKKMPTGGRVKSFEDMSLEKRKKAKEAAKLQRRREAKASKKAERKRK